MTTLLRSAAALALLAPAALHAQAGDSVLARIQRLGMDSSRAMDLLQVLSDSIGPRLTGTPQQKAGNRWLVNTYQSWGIPARNEPYGTWRGWTRGTLHVDLLTPRERTLEAWLLGWSPGTGDRVVTGSVVAMPEFADSAAMARWLPTVRGKFLLVSRPEPSCRPSESYEEHGGAAAAESARRARTEADSTFNRRLQRAGLTTRTLPAMAERAGAAGIISGNWSAGWGVTKLVTRARTERIPHLLFSCEDFGLVARLAENGQGPTIRVRSSAEVGPDVPVWNTVAELKGRERPDEYVMLSAHFDTWDAASGTTDNGTGTVVMMEALRILKQVYPNPRRTILVGHWSGEEQGLNGSRAFAADHPEVVRGLQALFNQDNGTGPVVNVSGSGLARAGDVLGGWLQRLPADIGRRVQGDFPGRPATGGSDHASFACYGAPSFGLRSANWDYSQYTWHTDRDTYDKVVPENVKANATLVAMLAYLASEEPAAFPRDRAADAPLAECTKPVRAFRDFMR